MDLFFAKYLRKGMRNMQSELEEKVNATNDPDELKRYLEPLEDMAFCQVIKNCADPRKLDNYVPQHKFPAYTIALHCIDHQNISSKQRQTIQNLFLATKADK